MVVSRHKNEDIDDLINWLKNNHPEIDIVRDVLPTDNNTNEKKIDLVVSIGGDGTILHTSQLFQNGIPPIIMPFFYGSLGFLNVFKFDEFKECLQEVLDGNAFAVNIRTRLACKVLPSTTTYHVLNEVVVDRGASGVMVQLELYADSFLLTTLLADGLVVATSTGSTAYSLSAAGSLVHPDSTCLLVTPICPHTLTCRPMILSGCTELLIRVPHTSRSTAWASFDARHRTQLHKGDAITVTASPFPLLTVCKQDPSKDWFYGVREVLGWNSRATSQAQL